MNHGGNSRCKGRKSALQQSDTNVTNVLQKRAAKNSPHSIAHIEQNIYLCLQHRERDEAFKQFIFIL